jgi:hypothetical protein
MEPIEQELEDRKARLHKLAIEHQRLEEQLMAATLPSEQADLYQKLARCTYQLDAVRFVVQDLEEIIAEGRSPKRSPLHPPDTSRRRVLTDEEREDIAADYRRELLKKFRAESPGFRSAWLDVKVERITDLEGKPICGFFVRAPKRNR